MILLSPIKIHYIGETPVMRAMERSTCALLEIKKTSFTEAQFIIAENLKDIEGNYSKEKLYAIITVRNDFKKNIPENVRVIEAPFAIAEFIDWIAKSSTSIKPDSTNLKSFDMVDVPLLPNAKNILVIDDSPKNIAGAKTQLAGHKLMFADGYESAMKTLQNNKFDIVLTDLYLPMSSKTLSDHAFRMGELVPYGFLLMLEAARLGASFIAIVTDLGHHGDCFSAAFDHFERFSITIEKAKTRLIHIGTNTDDVKEWSCALKNLLSEKGGENNGDIF